MVQFLRTQREICTDRTDFFVRLTESRVMLSAPHNKASLRDSCYKQRDRNVGVIAVEAARLAGASAVLPTTPGDLDGNWDTGSRFRRLLFSLLPDDAVVFDVHGMADAGNPDVVVGTAGTAPGWLVEVVSEVLVDAGLMFDVRSSGPLSACGRTLTATCNSMGTSAVQLEFARRWRNGDDPDRMALTIDTLAEIARRVAVSGPNR